MWTLFWDMHSGGRTKMPPYEQIYIEAPEKEAEIVFFNRFDRNPHHVTCTCCGEDYSLSEFESIEEATSYHRKKVSVEEHEKREDVLFIRAEEIKPEEREGELEPEGYVWD